MSEQNFIDESIFKKRGRKRKDEISYRELDPYEKSERVKQANETLD